MPRYKEGDVVRFANSPQCQVMRLTGRLGVVTEVRKDYVRVRPDDTRRTMEGFWLHRQEVRKAK